MVLSSHLFKRAVVFVFVGLCAFSLAAQNHPPQVQILQPDSGSSLPTGRLIPYRISVSDAEDGESKYGEINGTEVFLRVKYATSADVANIWLQQSSEHDAPGFVLLQKSNCINCHAFRAPGIGPSFADICGRYPNSMTNTVVLAQRILSGASGIWGTQVMPSHPEFTERQAREIVAWILSHAGDPTTTYYAGTEGTLTLQPPQGASGPSLFVLRASYTDHGVPGDSLTVQGQDAIVVHTNQP